MKRGVALDDRAASQIVSFIVGIALFASAVAFALAHTNRDQHIERMDTSEFAAMAATIALRLAGTPGVPSAWETLPLSDVEVLGLSADVETPYVLDAAKLERFRGHERPADDRISNLTGAQEFGVHLRLSPAIGVMANGSVAEFASTSLGYLARRDGSVDDSKRETANSAPATAEELTLRRLAFRFRASTAGSLDYTSAGDVHPDSRPDLARELVPRLAGFESVAYTDEAAASGTWKVVRKGAYASPAWWTGAPERVLTTGDYSVAHGAFLPATGDHSITLPPIDLTGHDLGWSSRLELNHWFDTGLAVPEGDAISVRAKCIANCSGASVETTLWSATSDVGAKSHFADTNVDLTLFMGKVVRVRLAFDRGSVLPPPRGGEGWFLAHVRVESTRATSTATLYDNTLDYNTTSYRALVVGSEFDHAALLADDGIVRTALTDWIVAGGRLLVLGTSRPDPDWLEGTFAVEGAPLSASALLADASDLTHPLVTTPNELAVASLDWSAESYLPTADYVTVLRGEEEVSPGVHAPLLSVTRATARFDGAVMLATARPGLDDDARVARDALANWMAYLVHAGEHAELGDSVPARTPFGYADAPVSYLDEDAVTRAGVLSVFVWR